MRSFGRQQTNHRGQTFRMFVAIFDHSKKSGYPLCVFMGMCLYMYPGIDTEQTQTQAQTLKKNRNGNRNRNNADRDIETKQALISLTNQKNKDILARTNTRRRRNLYS